MEEPKVINNMLSVSILLMWAIRPSKRYDKHMARYTNVNVFTYDYYKKSLIHMKTAKALRVGYET